MTQGLLHPLTLRFFDAETERGFQEYDFSRLVAQCRLATPVAIVSYLMLGILFDDWLYPADDQLRVWVIRMSALCVPVAVMCLSYHSLFQRINQLPMALIGLAGGVGIILMGQYLIQGMAAYNYPALIIISFYTYNFIGTRFIYALVVDLLLLLLFNLMVWHSDATAATIALQDFYIVTANLIGGCAGYLSELQLRKLFVSELGLRTEMKKALDARYEAELAVRAKSHFLAAVSHDLRQPVHAQGLYLSMLGETELTANQQEIVSRISAASATTNMMLHAMMDLSRIEAGVIRPDIKPFPVQPLLNRVENAFIALADAKNLAYRSRETDVVVRSDPALVEAILRNLVSNAIRYTHRGGVLLACRKRDGHAVLEVYDTGIGIDASQHREIFREFHQVANPERDHRKGLGLGLAIVDGLVKTLGHTLSLSSIPGRGSVFRLALPLAEAAAVQMGEVTEVCTSGRLHASLKILLIEDDEAVRAGTAQQLQLWGFECEAVDGMEAALVAAAQRPPEFIICDYRLPNNQTGANAVAALRQLLGKPLPALLITGDTAQDRMREAEAAGIPLLHKPVVPAELFHRISVLLETASIENP